MERFLSKDLYNEMDDLIERLDALREVLVDARDAVNFEEFDNLMEDAYIHAHHMSSDVDELREAGSELHLNEEDDDTDVDDDSGEYQQNFVNALNNFIRYHK